MGIEFSILDWFQTLHTSVGNGLMIFATRLGNAGMIWILLTIICLAIPRMRKTGWVLAAALIAELILCNGILKNLIARTRPYDINNGIQLLIPKPTDYSFPSGHTAASFAVVTALYLTRHRILWKVALVLGCMIAVSRMYLYVHFPTDVLGGVVIGVICGIIGYVIISRIQKKKAL